MSLLNMIRFVTGHPLNHNHQLRSILRVVKWQVGSRLVPGAIVYDWVNGSKFLVRNGETGLTGNIYTGLHEFADMGFLLHFLRAEDLFIDIGANVGAYTILACSAVGARGVVFEPVPSTYQRLIENMRINDLDERVQCINKGVGIQEGKIVFTSDSDTTNHALASGEHSENKVTVEVTSLDTALRGEDPVLMKIDVEGYETPVLKGGQEILKKRSLHAVIMELNGSGGRYGFDESDIVELMLRHGFKRYSYNPLTRTLANAEKKNAHENNSLFIRNRSFVEERLRVSPKVTVHGRHF